MECWEMELRNVLTKDAPVAKPVKDSDDESESLLMQNRRMASKLAIVADILADAGVIHSTPMAKANWITGENQ